MSPEEHEARFWVRVEKTDTCWIWVGGKANGGYGLARQIDGKATGAHRVAWTITMGEIPGGYELDHLCRTVDCVNPDHLEPVTPRENKRRAGAAVRFCKWGHEYTAENTYIRTNGTRQCKLCAVVRRQANPQPSRATGIRRLKTHCKHGHQFPEDPKLDPRGTRVCVPCDRARNDAKNARKRAARQELKRAEADQ